MTRSNEQLTEALCDTVAAFFKSGTQESLTVKQVRTAVEQSLGLKPLFFKSDVEWKDKSKTIIDGEYTRQEDLLKEKAKSKPSSNRNVIAESNAHPPPAPKTKKRVQSEALDDITVQSSDNFDEPKMKKARINKSDKSEAFVEEDDDGEATSTKPPMTKKRDSRDAGSLSSDGVDKSPMKKISSKPKSHRSKSESKTTPDDPKQQKIKALQGWLRECGIRKIWAFELKKFESQEDRIAHLEGLLRDVGMTGRFSKARAKEIKEKRELDADAMAVKTFDTTWGDKKTGEEKARRSKTLAVPDRLSAPTKGKLVAKGLADLAMFDDDDDDTSD